ncbi:hypothetical protein ONZ45_g14690 [Pleurotus djamor]|nr:hypothetical protein ONZ45_g14690 [Pleurotus djamor]
MSDSQNPNGKAPFDDITNRRPQSQSQSDANQDPPRWTYDPTQNAGPNGAPGRLPPPPGLPMPGPGALGHPPPGYPHPNGVPAPGPYGMPYMTPYPPPGVPSGYAAHQPPPLLPPPNINDPLAPSDDEELPPPHRMFDNIRPASRVAGVRRSDSKGKGKQRASTNAVAGPSKVSKRKASVSAEPEVKKRGRAAGAQNYSSDDCDTLLNIASEVLPLAAKGWEEVATLYNEWAEENGRPQRTARSLELKFKAFVKTPKPTGDGECPSEIERAHEIDALMNEKADTRDLDDEDIVDSPPDTIELSSDDDDKPAPKTSVKVKAESKEATSFVARRTDSDRLSIRPPPRQRTNNQALLSKLTEAIDPATHAARADARAERSIQNTQLIVLSNQLRDSQATLDRLRTQLAEAERARSDAERRADRAEMMSMIHSHPLPPVPRSNTSNHRLQYVVYPGGGGSTIAMDPHEADHVYENQLREDPPGTIRYMEGDTPPQLRHEHAQVHTPTHRQMPRPSRVATPAPMLPPRYGRPISTPSRSRSDSASVTPTIPGTSVVLQNGADEDDAKATETDEN